MELDLENARNVFGEMSNLKILREISRVFLKSPKLLKNKLRMLFIAFGIFRVGSGLTHDRSTVA